MTLAPVQIDVVAVDILTDGVTEDTTVMVMVLEFAVLNARQLALEVNTQLT